VLRADVNQRLMCAAEVEYEPIERAHGVVFDDYFRSDIDALAPLIQDGLVQRLPDRIRATSRGRGLLRVIAMRFDRYLQLPGQPARHSRAI
jgi:oxygen-independent coproporphyrinogen-3 oxidase